MKRYSFRLQRVLDIKEVIQQIREREFASALNVWESEKLILARHREKLETYQGEIRGKRTLSVFELRFYGNYFAWLMSEIYRQLRRIAECEREIEKKKKRLENAFKERRVIENLKQRTRGEYIREFDKDQQFQSDEVSLSKFFLQEELISKLGI